MSETRVRNATIESTFLGIEDHGMFIAQVGMIYGSGGQAFQRILSPESTREVLTSILLAVGVDAWEKLRGKNCRVVTRGGVEMAMTVVNIPCAMCGETEYEVEEEITVRIDDGDDDTDFEFCSYECLSNWAREMANDK